MPSAEARRLIETLALLPHPEGGWYRELYRSADRVTAQNGSRAALTTIYYLLEREQRSRWHVVAADEVWHFYAGAPLELFSYEPMVGRLQRSVLASVEETRASRSAATAPRGDGGTPRGDNATVGVQVISRGVWQAARSLGEYTLVGCTVAPGFEFMDFCFVATLPDHEAHFAASLREFAQLL